MQTSFKKRVPTLFLVSTPIGNLQDITFRAVDILKQVDLIFAEDTRTSKVLLNHYQIETKLTSYHEHNKFEKFELIESFLSEGKDLALISDAGTPLLNDPGKELVDYVLSKGFYVVSIPGASALLTALINSNISPQPFTFIGFLPRKKKEMVDILNTYIERTETLIVYESPKRLDKTLETLYQVFGPRKIAIHRELTKLYETIERTDLKQAIEQKQNTLGEYVLVIEGGKKKVIDLPVKDMIEALLLEGFEEKEAMKQVAKAKGVTKSEIYKIYKT